MGQTVAENITEGLLELVADLQDPAVLLHKKDQDITVCYANKAYVSFTRFPADEISGRRVEDCFDLDQTEASWETLFQLNGNMCMLPLAVPRRGFQSFPCKSRCKKLRPDLILMRFDLPLDSGVINDHLLRAREFYLRLLHNFPIMVWRTDARQVADYFNRTMLEFTGCSLGEALGDGWLRGVHAEDVKRFQAEYDEAFVARRDFQIEFRLHHHSDEYRWVNANGKPFYYEDGSFAGYIGVCTDMTDLHEGEEARRLLDQELLGRQKAESLAVLAGGVAHDFNNLLVGVLGNAELALEELGDQPRLRDYLESIRQSALQAAGISNQMLAYSGRGCVNLIPLDLAQLLQHAEASLKRQLPTQLQLEIQAGPCDPIQGDAAQLSKMLHELVANAGEALEETGGRIVLSLSTRDCSQAYMSGCLEGKDLQAGRYVCLEITDTGCGMTREDQEKMFDPFFSTKFTGRGLGLAAVWGIVKGHHGTIRVTSQHRVGTSIQVFFPVAPQISPLQEENRSNWNGPMVWGGEKVIVIDDQLTPRQVAQTMLERAGFQVTTAATGPDALALAPKGAYDVALLDLTMPGMDGPEAYLLLREASPSLKIILMSGYPENDLSARYADMGFDGFLQKPFTQRELTEKIRDVLQAPAG